jgi:hypothetical protein
MLNNKLLSHILSRTYKMSGTGLLATPSKLEHFVQLSYKNIIQRGIKRSLSVILYLTVLILLLVISIHLLKLSSNIQQNLEFMFIIL